MFAQNSNQTRANVYTQAVSGALSSPVLGYGSPRPDPTARAISTNLPFVGTQGQYPLVLFSHGFPGLAAFIGWFAFAFVRTRRCKQGDRDDQHREENCEGAPRAAGGRGAQGAC